MCRLLVLVLCFSMVTTQRNGNNNAKEPRPDQREIQRQNQITEQIVTNFLERRLFPFRRPQQKVPTIDDILLPSSFGDPGIDRKLASRKLKTATDLHDKAGVALDNERNTGGDTADIDDGDQTDYGEHSLDDSSYPDSLQSVESEQVDSVYDDSLNSIEGRCFAIGVNATEY